MATSLGPRENRARSFIDTNILVYTDDPRDAIKNRKACELIIESLCRQSGVISLQVLQEYFYAVTKKLRLDAVVAKQRVEFFARLHLVEPTLGDVLAAIDMHRLHQISYWDALIIRCAKQMGCSKLFTEDMQHGQVIDGVRIVNPFI